MTKPMKPKVFISYSMADKQLAETLLKDLSERGISTFMDVRDLNVGENWEEFIKNEIQSASHFVVLLSDNFIGSHWGMQELGAAIALGAKIVPVLIGNPKIPFDISKYAYLDMRENNMKSAMEKFREAVTQNNE